MGRKHHWGDDGKKYAGCHANGPELRAAALTRAVQKRTYGEAPIRWNTSDERVGFAAERAKTLPALHRVDVVSCALVTKEAEVTRAVERDAPDAEIDGLEFAAAAVGASVVSVQEGRYESAEAYAATAKRGEQKRKKRAADRVAHLEATAGDAPKDVYVQAATNEEHRAAQRKKGAAYRARGYRGERDGDDAEHTLQMRKHQKTTAKKTRRRKDRAVKAGLVPKPKPAFVPPRAAKDAALPCLEGLGSCTYATNHHIRDWTRIRVRVKKENRKGTTDLKNDVPGTPDHGKPWWNSEEAAIAAFNAHLGL
jgi:hypothetical protein